MTLSWFPSNGGTGGMVQLAGKIGSHFLRSLELPPRALTPPSPLAAGRGPRPEVVRGNECPARQKVSTGF
jgi:hypothetical protein